jgi:hypothetical protein
MNSIALLRRHTILPRLILAPLPTIDSRTLLWSCHRVVTFSWNIKIPLTGVEPATLGLKDPSSTVELTVAYHPREIRTPDMGDQ